MATVVLHTDAYRKPSVAVLKHSRRHRVAILKDAEQPRSVAVTLFPRAHHQKLAVVDTAIRDGALMGMTFKKHGFAVQQNRLFTTRLWLPAWITKHLGYIKGQKLRVEVYEFYGNEHLYGIVVEYTSVSHDLPPRPSYGARSVWRAIGKTAGLEAQILGQSGTYHWLRYVICLITSLVASWHIIQTAAQIARLSSDSSTLDV